MGRPWLWFCSSSLFWISICCADVSNRGSREIWRWCDDGEFFVVSNGNRGKGRGTEKGRKRQIKWWW
ncbi:hypothetical protein LINGRAHAP2_LOCUS10459 [Linum grandiflorum]